MISKATIKFVQSLARKKGRDESGCFLAEGNRLVEDTLGSMTCRLLVATHEWMAAHPHVKAHEAVTVTPAEMERVSLQKSPQDVLAVYVTPQHVLDEERMSERLTLLLDTVQDPGNLGTIVRIADWMGIGDVVCSPQTADVYAPKTVQSTMGALSRVAVHYLPPEPFLQRMVQRGVPVYGTFVDGDNIYDMPLTEGGIIVMGNEGNGISAGVAQWVSHRLYIPNYPPGAPCCESLNVAVATAITCAEFRRRAAK